MRYIVTSPWWLRIFFPGNIIWNLPSKEKIIYLTFDDGPHPEITNLVLDELKKYNAKATFFCVGENVASYPETYKKILTEGHRTGNHTHNHLNGWKTDNKTWLQNVKEASKWIDSDLFRPPYGKIRPIQAKILREITKPFRIIMWNLISGDFDISISPEQCWQNVKKHTKPGSIIVFHDSEKALPRLSFALKLTLEYFTEKGYRFEAIS